MKTIRVAIIVILLFAPVATLAESYQIRVSWPVRLRASYSLDSPVVGKALAGDVLQVAGRFNRWLKIDRDGEIVWLADWVDYTRLDQEQSAADNQQQQPTGIDNCCFVDRQCHSQREWGDGYWAYQRGECPAPAQQQLPLAPPSDPTRPHIEGSPIFVRWIESKLNRLESASPYWYNYVISYLDFITEVPDATGPDICQALAYSHERRTTIEMDCHDVLGGGGITLMLVHEACHVYHYEQGITYPEGHLREEWECAKPSIAVGQALSANGYGGELMPWDEYLAWYRSEYGSE